MSAVTLLFPLKQRWLPYLRLLARTAHVLPLPRWTLLRLKRIHFLRWAIVARVPPGGPRARSRRVRPRYMLFESNYNGGFDSYIDAFSYAFPLGMRLIFGGCQGFPGAQPVSEFKPWILKHQVELAHWHCAYPQASTRAVLSALEVRRRLQGFERETAGLDPAGFRRRYDELLAELHNHV